MEKFHGVYDKEFFAYKIQGLTERYAKIFGEQLNQKQKVRSFCDNAKTDYIDLKSKKSIKTAVNAWIKENKPKEYFLRIKQGIIPNFYGDSVKIYYID